MSNYDSDDALRLSPPLRAVKPKFTPSPSPPPIISQQAPITSSAQNVSPPSSRSRKKSNRRKTRPSQGDFVLIRVMEPNRPDIARLVGERALNSDSGSEPDDDEMSVRSQTAEPTPSEGPADADNGSSNLKAIAKQALDTDVQPPGNATLVKPPPPPFHRDSVVEPDTHIRSNIDAETPTSQPSSTPTLANGSPFATNGLDLRSPANSSSNNEAASPSRPTERHGSFANGYHNEESLATSPNLQGLTIPQSRASPSQKLPAMQDPNSPSRDGQAGSPHQERTLPSFRQIDAIAQAANREEEQTRASGYAHRQSISSSNQSPTSGARQLSISSSRSPGSAFPPLSATSPVSTKGELTTRDPFLRAGHGHLTLFSTRRPSQASEGGPYSATLHSASTNDSYQSSEGLSPGTQPTPIDGAHRMSIDGIASRTLPPPTGTQIQHVPPHGAGNYQCDHPGCTAPPFQTQYLLNSHANVHSQTRPHFCPVPGCNRGEGGKGFKRKNEMIRHGLVHASPGYICPFCPDREHKYPRPDNLQRHVRVHHVDKDKDDPQLREVLAQRPEGGSRGRRRRVGSDQELQT